MPKWTKEQSDAVYKDGTNIIVSAGAGSGKTAVLTERVLEKIKTGVSLNNLLILTFTKLAAKEMRERIGDKLKKNNLNAELELLDAADITTFDAYALGLVKKYHYYLNVSKDISIIESSVIEIYKKKALEVIFNNLYEEEDKDFLALIKDYCIKDDNEIFNYILMLNNKLDLKNSKLNYLDNYLKDNYNDEIIESNISEYVSQIFTLIDKIRVYLEYIDDNDYLEKIENSLSGLISSYTYEEVVSNINIKLPIARSVSDTTKEYKDKINECIKEIKALCSFSSEKEMKEQIMWTKGHIKTIINIIKKLDSEVRVYKNKYDFYEYSDIANLAIKLVKENDIVRNEIKDNLNEILIDEYQDTNDIQEEFISYIANNNVYMVGDIKQSIYKFRNANPYIFKNKYDNYSNNNGGIKIDLNKNFRSRQEVIEDINKMFNKVMDDDIGGADYIKSHQMIFGNNTYNEIGLNNQNNNFEIYSYLNDTIYKKEEIEAFIIAKDIKRKVEEGYLIFDKEINQNRKVKYGDITILMDNSRNFELFKKILEYESVPTTIMKSGNLLDGELIIIIKNIINLIIKVKSNSYDIEFKKLFMSLGRSFLFQIDDNTLFNYFLNNNFYDSAIYKICKEISSNTDYIPLDEILDIIIDKFDFYNKLILIGDYQKNIIKIDKLKEITNNLVDLNYDIYSYNDYLNNIVQDNIKIEYQINEEGNDSVRIMTIHASKGLEFNICYFASLYSKFNIREVINKFTYDSKYGIIMPYKNNFLYNTIYHTLSYKDYVKENISERIRLFYVALTRAKEKMIFILPQKDNIKENTMTEVIDLDIRKKYSSFADILYSLNSIIKDNYHNIDLNDINLTKKYNMINDSNYKNKLNVIDTKLNVKEISISPSSEEDKSFSKNNMHFITKEEKEKLDYGKRMHEIFEMIDFMNPNYENLDYNEETMIKAFLKLLDLTNSISIYKEYEFVYEENNISYHGIIDLMIEYENSIKIIDYKLKGINDEAYLLQLNGYKNYIERVFNKTVDIYLYSIILKELEKI